MAFVNNKRMDTATGNGQPGNGQSHFHGDFGKKIITTLLAVFLVYLILYVGVLMRNNARKFNYIGVADQMERTLTVNGLGKVNGKNDIAVTTIGYSNTDKEVSKAQAENKRVMDQLMAELKKLGVADKDMQTNYSIYPEYNYTQDKGQELKGYRVSNNVMVKIRDLTKISAILSLPGKYGATEVSGLNFTIDDPENLKAEARDKAVADAKMKAVKLAASLGAQLVEVISYNEYEAGDYPQPMYTNLKFDGMGSGGPAPEAIAGGSKDVVINVSLTYKIVRR